MGLHTQKFIVNFPKEEERKKEKEKNPFAQLRRGTGSAE